jgi:hypothetical protein
MVGGGVAMSPDGTLIATSCRCAGPAFRPVRLWHLDGTEDLGVGDLGQMAEGFAFSPDGASLAIAQALGPSGTVTIKLGGGFSPTASRAAAAGQSGVIYQWCDLGLP